MKYCEKCKVNIVGNRTYCPLCQVKLRSDGISEKEAEGKEVFPYIPTLYQQHYMFFKILTFLSVVLIVVIVTLNIMFHKHGWWSLFVVAGVICLWAVMFITFRKRKNVPKNILYQVVILSIISVLWDNSTGWRGWSVDYVIPIVCLSVLLAMVFLSKLMDSDTEDYMIYTMIGAVFGILPIIFLFFGILHVKLPSLICVAASIIFLSAIFIFQGNKMIMELKRRLHL